MFIIALFLVLMMKSSTSLRLLSNKVTGIGAILDNYDSFIIDQWGVLHDGKKLYPGVLECLQAMKTAGKRMIMLSNSSKGKSASFDGLVRVGIDPTIFEDIVTSGEVVWNKLNVIQKTGVTQKVFVIGNGADDLEYIKSCGCIPVSPESADFVLARGTFSVLECSNPDNELLNFNDDSKNNIQQTIFPTAEDLMKAIDPWLQRCAARNLPMIVSNPDFHRPGSNSPMPGLIGKRYNKILTARTITDYNTITSTSTCITTDTTTDTTGGTTAREVHNNENHHPLLSYYGKPYSTVYDICKNILVKNGDDVSMTSRICCIGDSLDHDVLGASYAGFASLWTANGVHCDSLGTTEGSFEMPSDDSILDLLRHANMDSIHPTHISASFHL